MLEPLRFIAMYFDLRSNTEFVLEELEITLPSLWLNLTGEPLEDLEGKLRQLCEHGYVTREQRNGTWYYRLT